MKGMNDNEFDDIFKQRMSEGLPEFEETSWLLMEHKLQRRDRSVFMVRITAVFVIFALAGILAITMWPRTYNKQATYTNARNFYLKDTLTNKTTKEIGLTKANNSNTISSAATVAPVTDNGKNKMDNLPNEFTAKVSASQNANEHKFLGRLRDKPLIGVHKSALSLNLHRRVVKSLDVRMPEKVKTNNSLPISLALSLSPNINYTGSDFSAKGNLAFGLGVNIPMYKKLALQVGINYGNKRYDAGANDYSFRNPNIAPTIAKVEALCKVVEIPVNLSYKLQESTKNSLSISAGLSSYLMLKEDYTYLYTAESGKADRYLNVNNKNQHVLGVANLAIEYQIKLHPKMGLAIEPFLRVPLTGIGEGKTSLKSTGVSIKLNKNFLRKQTN